MLETLGPHPLGWGVADTPETRSYPKRITTQNFVAVGQTIWAYGM